VQWRFFGTTEQFWLNLQGAYGISRVKAEHSADLNRIEPLKSGKARI
jgi:plasmid maintenance system antidote protein VapI